MTPASVLRRAIQKGTTHYLMLLEQVPLGERFRTAVNDALDRGKAALAGDRTEATQQPLGRVLARSAAGKTEAHDAIQLLQEIDVSGQALVVKFPRRGIPVVIAGDIGIPLDAGRLGAIRSSIRQQGGAARLRASSLRPGAAPSTVVAFGCLERGFDGTDTALIWLLPDEQTALAQNRTPPEIILRLVLSAVMRSSDELCRDLALEAMELGLQLDLATAYELGIERGQLAQLVRWRSTCEQACRMVEAEFRAFLYGQNKEGSLWHRVRIEYRVKTCASILAKFRNSTRLVWPDLASLRDIAGVRIISPTEWHSRWLLGFLDESKGERTLDGPIERYDLEPTLLGYRGAHAVRLVRVPHESGLVPCEVQVRTLIQDAWSTLSHGIAYKASRKTNSQERARLRALSTALAECDKTAAAIFAKARDAE
jgi:ppGpp synthetase/RelA/SpoT-type nucleotidyltranferase